MLLPIFDNQLFKSAMAVAVCSFAVELLTFLTRSINLIRICMDEDNMFEDTTQKPPPSVFRFDAYPGGPSIFPWETNNQQPKFGSPPMLPLTNTPIFPNFTAPHMNSPPVAPQVPTSFSFGTPPSSSMDGQFPFQITTHELGERSFKLVLGKRKTESPPLQPRKQLITEEKMAEHMSRLHISSESVTSPLEPESVRNKRLYMCEEMRKLQAEPIIPPCLVSQIQRPCTALVLWQPPNKLLPGLDDESRIRNKRETQNENMRFHNFTNKNDVEQIEVDSDIIIGNMDMDA